ncbi:MAG: hypothetical protein JSS76_00645 [Bacteroidetes bacterium]|nr:hypothetical protein [Bacteroidota bacterium]
MILGWVLLGYGIYKLLSQEIKEKVQREEEKIEEEIAEFKVRYVESKIELDRRIQDAKRNINFQNCIDAHYQSMMTSNIAYGILDREQRLKGIYYNGIKDIDTKITNTKKERDKYKAHTSEREEKHKEMQSGIDLKNGILAHLKIHSDKSKEILLDVKELNNKTRDLKFLIRDNFGQKGLEWFNRLEERTNNRKRS